ncbi:MAG: alpha/beta fold hydrolase [Candidatus Natronoplasma sp.]
MNRSRRYGDPPYDVVVIHGGPGALGDAGPLAKELSEENSVIEPFFDQVSVAGQLDWLREVIERFCDNDVVLIGHSWGAWLAWMFAAESQRLDKLIMISSPPFKDEYVEGMKEALLEHMNGVQKKRYLELKNRKDESERAMREYGKLIMEASSYDLTISREYDLEVIGEVNEKVWREAEKLRRSGEILKKGRSVDCSVVAFHGDYDHHPAEGVKTPLSERLKDFKFVLLNKCGHYPWYEREAKEKFFRELKEEM